jgi:hypothetical protein
LTAALLIKFSKKISEPVGHGLLKDVLFTEVPSDGVLNMAQELTAGIGTLYAQRRWVPPR